MLEDRILELLRDSDDKVIAVILKVMVAEQSRLHQKLPRGINEEIRHIIEEEVRKP